MLSYQCYRYNIVLSFGLKNVNLSWIANFVLNMYHTHWLFYCFETMTNWWFWPSLVYSVAKRRIHTENGYGLLVSVQQVAYRAVLNVKPGRIPKFSTQYAFDSYPSRFNSVRFLTLILISSTSNSFSIQNSLEKRKSCCFITWYNSNMSISLGMATSDCKNNARFGFHIPKNKYTRLYY